MITLFPIRIALLSFLFSFLQYASFAQDISYIGLEYVFPLDLQKGYYKVEISKKTEGSATLVVRSKPIDYTNFKQSVDREINLTPEEYLSVANAVRKVKFSDITATPYTIHLDGWSSNIRFGNGSYSVTYSVNSPDKTVSKLKDYLDAYKLILKLAKVELEL